MSQRCTGLTKRGIPCKAWAARGSAPPRCAAHQKAGVAQGGATCGGGAPGATHTGNTNSHSVSRQAVQSLSGKPPRTIDDAIDLLSHNLLALQQTIDHQVNEATPEQMLRWLQLQGQNLSRFSRMLRDQRALSGEAADGIAGAIAQALDELGTELGTDL